MDPNALRIYLDSNLVQYASYMMNDPNFHDDFIFYDDTLSASPTYSKKVASSGERWHDEMKALRFILDMDDQIPMVFVTSKVTLEEIQRAPKGKSDAVKKVYESLMLPGNPIRWRLGKGRGRPPTKETLMGLQQLLSDLGDARHVYYSLLLRCNVFLTCDHRTILVHAEQLKAFGVKAMSPYQLMVNWYGKGLWRRGAGLGVVR